jgi:hypothetical protein
MLVVEEKEEEQRNDGEMRRRWGELRNMSLKGKPSVSQALFLPFNQCFLFRTFFGCSC